MMCQRHVSITALAACGLLAVCAAGDDAPPRPAPQAAAPSLEGGRKPPADDPLRSLNDASRAAYRRAREETLARGGPVVLLEGDDLVLVYGVFRSSAHVTPETYRVLKSVSHVPLAIHALLDGRGGTALGEKRLYDLKRYRDLVEAAAGALAGQGLAPEQVKRARAITDDSLAFLAGVIAAGRVEDGPLDEYRRRMRPLLEANAAEAARAQIDALHRQMKTWKGRLTDAEWGKLRVLVMGTQLPRRENLAVQYFTRLLGEPGEGGRVVYAEAIFDEARALDLLGTRLVDTRIGTAFFGDATRMHRDLLADAAREYLDELFPKAKP